MWKNRTCFSTCRQFPSGCPFFLFGSFSFFTLPILIAVGLHEAAAIRAAPGFVFASEL